MKSKLLDVFRPNNSAKIWNKRSFLLKKYPILIIKVCVLQASRTRYLFVHVWCSCDVLFQDWLRRETSVVWWTYACSTSFASGEFGRKTSLINLSDMRKKRQRLVASMIKALIVARPCLVKGWMAAIVPISTEFLSLGASVRPAAKKRRDRAKASFGRRAPIENRIRKMNFISWSWALAWKNWEKVRR